jgi:membrane-associated phospholipid phosphatase
MEIIWLIAFYLYTTGGYFWFSSRPTTTHFMTPWEKLVPTFPIFLIPYLFATLTFLTVPIFFYLKLGWVKTKAYLITQAIATSIGYFVYFFFPTSVVREALTGQGFWWDLLRTLHANDRPSAAFPSGHVYHTTVIAYFFWVYLPITRPFVAVILPLVVVSTVLLKQHYLPDIVGGLITAIIAIVISKYLLKVI